MADASSRDAIRSFAPTVEILRNPEMLYLAHGILMFALFISSLILMIAGSFNASSRTEVMKGAPRNHPQHLCGDHLAGLETAGYRRQQRA